MKSIRTVLLTIMMIAALAGCGSEDIAKISPEISSPEVHSAPAPSDPKSLPQQTETGDGGPDVLEDNTKTTALDPDAAAKKSGSEDGGSAGIKDNPDVFGDGSREDGKQNGGLLPSGEDVYHAYYELLAEFVSQYGVCETVFEGSGLFRGTLIDFDGDGIEELICYYCEEVELIYSGYIVFGYNQESGKAELFEDHRDMAIERNEVSIFRGLDGKVYAQNYCGQSQVFSGDFSTMEDNAWKTVLRWQEIWNEDWTNVEYTLNGIKDVSAAKANSEFEKYQAELIYKFELYNWDAPEHPPSNIDALLHELASRII
ncbi:MAG: hypothetical protein FWH57_10130 [Oscillospiraceae bacterium]|nr:hypothetical protein [Oscillospiraceae bacterium]